MKKQEALQLLDSAVSSLQVNRQTHAKLQEAVRVLTDAIKTKKKLSEKQS